MGLVLIAMTVRVVVGLILKCSLQPAALVSVPYGFVLARVRVRGLSDLEKFYPRRAVLGG